MAAILSAASPSLALLGLRTLTAMYEDNNSRMISYMAYTAAAAALP